MRTEIVIGLDGVGIDAHDHDGLMADFVDGVVARVGYFIEASGHLPGFEPQLFVFELGELRIGVTSGSDPVI